MRATLPGRLPLSTGAHQRLYSAACQVLRQPKTFEVIFVSSDNSEEEFSSYFSSMPWASVPWGATRSLKSCLEVAYGSVPIIPSLIAVDLATQRLLTRSARAFVGRFVVFAFCPKPKP